MSRVESETPHAFPAAPPAHIEDYARIDHAWTTALELASELAAIERDALCPSTKAGVHAAQHGVLDAVVNLRATIYKIRGSSLAPPALEDLETTETTDVDVTWEDAAPLTGKSLAIDTAAGLALALVANVCGWIGTTAVGFFK